MQGFKNTLVQITNEGMGTGNEELSLLLMKNYLNLLNEENELPKVMAFYNGGVKLLCEGSPVIDSFKILEQRGVKLVACKTCLNYFDLMDQFDVGIAGTMMDIIEFQKVAEKVINL